MDGPIYCWMSEETNVMGREMDGHKDRHDEKGSGIFFENHEKPAATWD